MDHTSSLQSLLDRGGNVFFPKGSYTVSESLMIGDNTHLTCEMGTHLRLADGANCPILINRIRDGAEYTQNVIIEGGVWDGNNIAQNREEYPKNGRLGCGFGQLIVLTGVRDLTIRSLTVKDPNSFGIQLADTERFTVSDIFFDCNKKTGNQDGLHIDGYARNGYISNLKGWTNDDFVALNSDEGDFTGNGNDIENIVIDGIFGGTDGWTAIRLLSRKANVRHITIRNIFGEYKYNAVSFTHWAEDPVKCGRFDDILIESVHCCSCRKEGSGHGGIVWFQNDTTQVGTVVIRDVFRTEPEDRHNTTSLVEISDRVIIKSLHLSSIHEKLPIDKPMITQGEDVKIGTLTLDGTMINPSMLPIKKFSYVYGE